MMLCIYGPVGKKHRLSSVVNDLPNLNQITTFGPPHFQIFNNIITFKIWRYN